MYSNVIVVLTIASWVGRSKLHAFEPLVTRLWENILVAKLICLRLCCCCVIVRCRMFQVVHVGCDDGVPKTIFLLPEPSCMVTRL